MQAARATASVAKDFQVSTMVPDELSSEPLVLEVDADGTGMRLDVFLADRITRHSRVELRKAIHAGNVTVNGHRSKPSYRLRLGQSVSVVLPQEPRKGSRRKTFPWRSSTKTIR